MLRVADTAEIIEAAERLSGLLAGLDAGEVLPSTAKELVALGEKIERCGHALKVTAAARVVEAGAWREPGVRSPEDWLATATGTSKGRAKRAIDTGRKLEQLPTTAQAAKTGKLSAEQAEAIAEAAAAAPAQEAALLDAAGTESLGGLKQRCAQAKAQADPDPEATARRIHAKRACRTWTDAEGVGHLHLSGPSSVVGRMANAINHRADQLFRTARTDGRREPSEAYGFDAAEQLLTTGGDGAQAPRGADAKIIVRVDHAVLLRGRAEQGETCEIAGLGPVPVSTVWEWMGDAFIAAVLTKGTEVSKVVHLGRRFTAEQRTALQWQDPVCARRGCNNRLHLEYDHFDEWSKTKQTCTKSGKRFCEPCHQLKSIGWHVSAPGPDGQCDFTPPDTAADRAAAARACAEAVAAIATRTQNPPANGDPPTLFEAS
jgi:hypothetical protein